MKPITNLLLVLALICYVFLPFYNIELMKSGMSGFEFTASTITDFHSITHTLFALLPFLACFAAITFNCLKHRYWGCAASACIIVGLYFFATAPEFHSVMPSDPDVAPSVDLGEALSVRSFGIGYKLSYVLTALSLVSAIISLMPFKFNKTFEEAIDNSIEKGFEEGKKHITMVGHEIHDELSRLDAKKLKAEKSANKGVAPVAEKQIEKQEEKPVEEKEEQEKHETSSPTSAYMPEGAEAAEKPVEATGDDAYKPKEASTDEQYAAYMPKEETHDDAKTDAETKPSGDDDAYSAYMPKEDKPED